MDEIPAEIVAALRDTLTKRGLRQWWTSGNRMLDGFSPESCWATPSNRARVIGAAWAFAEGMYV